MKKNKTEKAELDFFCDAVNEKDKARKQAKKKYKKTWGTKIGKDCVSLDTSLAKWLGERLLFLAKHSNSYPSYYADHKQWQCCLRAHGTCLLEYYNYVGLCLEEWTAEKETSKILLAKESIHWVAQHLNHLWD